MDSREVILITGGAGFIGSHLADRLAGDGRRVRILDDLSTGSIRTVEALQRQHGDRVEFLRGDVRDPSRVGEAMADVTEVLHQAALPSVERSVQDPWNSHTVNVDGTLRVLEACRGSGRVRRFVLAGSSSVYGDQPELPKRESMRPCPRSPYALGKWIAEEYARLYADLYGLSTMVLRYFNVFGPRQDPGSPYAAVIPLFLRAIHAGEGPVIYGDGLQTRDFTYIDNVVEANRAALAHPKAQGHVVNVACGQQTSLLELLDLLGKVTGRPVVPRFAPARVGDVRDSVADITRATEVLGFSPSIGLEEGLRRTAEAFRPAS